MEGLLIIGGIILVLMFVCRLAYKLIADAHARAGNAVRRQTEKPVTEDLKDRYK